MLVIHTLDTDDDESTEVNDIVGYNDTTLTALSMKDEHSGTKRDNLVYLFNS